MSQEKQKIYILCPGCNGAKQVPEPNWDWSEEEPVRPMVDCPRCNGEGHEEWGYLHVIQTP